MRGSRLKISHGPCAGRFEKVRVESLKDLELGRFLGSKAIATPYTHTELPNLERAVVLIDCCVSRSSQAYGQSFPVGPAPVPSGPDPWPSLHLCGNEEERSGHAGTWISHVNDQTSEYDS